MGRMCQPCWQRGRKRQGRWPGGAAGSRWPFQMRAWPATAAGCQAALLGLAEEVGLHMVCTGASCWPWWVRLQRRQTDRDERPAVLPFGRASSGCRASWHAQGGGLAGNGCCDQQECAVCCQNATGWGTTAPGLGAPVTLDHPVRIGRFSSVRGPTGGAVQDGAFAVGCPKHAALVLFAGAVVVHAVVAVCTRLLCPAMPWPSVAPAR